MEEKYTLELTAMEVKKIGFGRYRNPHGTLYSVLIILSVILLAAAAAFIENNITLQWPLVALSVIGMICSYYQLVLKGDKYSETYLAKVKQEAELRKHSSV